jgi:hypothetical protein
MVCMYNTTWSSENEKTECLWMFSLDELGWLWWWVSLCQNLHAQNDCDGKRLKTSGFGDENVDSKAEAEANSGKRVEENPQPPPEPPKQDYIHVRARRGQATDSHSLAERVISHFNPTWYCCLIWITRAFRSGQIPMTQSTLYNIISVTIGNWCKHVTVTCMKATEWVLLIGVIWWTG